MLHAKNAKWKTSLAQHWEPKKVHALFSKVWATKCHADTRSHTKPNYISGCWVSWSWNITITKIHKLLVLPNRLWISLIGMKNTKGRHPLATTIPNILDPKTHLVSVSCQFVSKDYNVIAHSLTWYIFRWSLISRRIWWNNLHYEKEKKTLKVKIVVSVANKCNSFSIVSQLHQSNIYNNKN